MQLISKRPGDRRVIACVCVTEKCALPAEIPQHFSCLRLQEAAAAGPRCHCHQLEQAWRSHPTRCQHVQGLPLDRSPPGKRGIALSPIGEMLDQALEQSEPDAAPEGSGWNVGGRAPHVEAPVPMQAALNSAAWRWHRGVGRRYCRPGPCRCCCSRL